LAKPNASAIDRHQAAWSEMMLEFVNKYNEEIMGEAKRKRRRTYDEMIECREATIEDLMAAQAPIKERPIMQSWPEPARIFNQDDIPPNLNVFATMEAAWQDLVDRWFHEGMPDKLKQDGKFIFFHGVQAAANLMMYCEGQDMFGAAADQVQGDCMAYEKEAEAVLAERKAEEWRTGEI
jgi:hypothetical protein